MSEIEAPVWREHQALLAQALDDADWFFVAAAYMSAGAVRRFADPDYGTLGDDETTMLAATADAIQGAVDRVAFKALPSQENALDWKATLERLDLGPRG